MSYGRMSGQLAGDKDNRRAIVAHDTATCCPDRHVTATERIVLQTKTDISHRNGVLSTPVYPLSAVTIVNVSCSNDKSVKHRPNNLRLLY